MRNNQRIFIFLFTFFIVVALGSLIFLGGRGSAFDKTRESLGSGTAALSQTITGLFGGEDEDNTAEVTAPVIEQAEKEEPVIQEPAVEETPVEEPVEEEPAEAADSFEIRYFCDRYSWYQSSYQAGPFRVSNDHFKTQGRITRLCIKTRQ